MQTVLVLVLVVLLVAAAAAITWLVAQRGAAAPLPAPVFPSQAEVPEQLIQRAVAVAVAQANQQASRERDQAVQAAVQHVITAAEQQLGARTDLAEASLAGRQALIDQRLGEVQAGMSEQLQRLVATVESLNQRTSEQFGQVDSSLRAQLEVTQALQGTTAGLREALANTNARGQWGERMADDVLQMAGMLVNINYAKRTAVAGEGRAIPDFTFFLPDRHVMFMDVKFPIDSYLMYLQAGTEAERAAHRDAFLRAVKGHVRELARRDYASIDDRPAVDNVLMFVPNETIAGFIHEHAPTLIDEALRDHVVLCSPLTLFAFLGVIRQAFDNFRMEQTSREMLALLGKFGTQWKKYNEQIDKVKRQFDSVATNFEELAGTRRRALERPLRELDELRQEQHIPIDGELFADGVLDVPPGRVRQLGA